MTLHCPYQLEVGLKMVNAHVLCPCSVSCLRVFRVQVLTMPYHLGVANEEEYSLERSFVGVEGSFSLLFR